MIVTSKVISTGFKVFESRSFFIGETVCEQCSCFQKRLWKMNDSFIFSFFAEQRIEEIFKSADQAMKLSTLLIF